MTVAPRRAADVPTWDEQADVVVVGFGAAGAAAAFEAASSGAETLVLERAGAAGGAAAMSDGFVYLGGGTPEQREAGFPDSVDNMKTFLKAACGPAPDHAKIDLYCERSLEHREWLLARGVRFLGTVLPDANGTSPVDGEGLMFTGGENAYPFDEIAAPAPRGHVVQGDRPGGARLMDALTAAALDAGARASFDTVAEALVTDDDGRVAGVVAARYGEEITVRARTGVVLTAGGFISNPDMVEQYAPAVHVTALRLGTEGDDGRGIRMAEAVGARIKRMDAIECALPFNAPRSLVHGILVNRLGQRFVNEDTYMGRVGQTALVHQGGHAYLIVDEAHYAPNWLNVPATWVCETAAELESEIGLPPGSLTTTLDYFNAHAADGNDPLFHKRAPVLTPLTPPLAAFDLRADKFFYAPFTLGGLHTQPDGAVLDLDGEPIPGLFAAGRTTSGVAAQGYCSGLSLGDSTLFGRLAGLSAAGVKA
ncbi:MAG: FAD-dependent oxidoreductase [Jatrophihabitans sp.]|uniref:FAD-dependent oxidoreductase n=1 Tax=Jatrophihabitans sp. TaxID=1932789 RepID=UPI003913AAC4